MLKKLLIALTPAGAAAFLAGGGTFSSFAELDAWSPEARPAPAARSGGGMTGIVKTKKVLLAMMAIAAAAYLGTGGTFATFSADTSNNGDSIASGTLTMDNSVNSGTLCLSANGAVNSNPNCDKVINITNVAPGVFTSTSTASVAIRNTGTIDATNFYLSAPYVNSTLSSPVAVTIGANSPTLQLNGLEGTVASGDTIRLTYGNNSQDFVAGANKSGTSSATTLAVSGTATTAYTFPTGTLVTDRSSDTTTANTDCYDSLTSGSVNGPTGGQNLPGFVTTTNNPFCTTVAMWVQETTGGPSSTQHYCWYGYTTGAGATAGACTAPISVNLSTATTCAATTLQVSNSGNGINGNVLSGDTIAVTNGTTVCTFTANSTSYVGATSLAVTPVTGGATVLSTSSVVTDTKATSDLNSNTSNTLNTISKFDTQYGGGNHLQLYPTTNNGSFDNTAGLVRLAHYNSGTYSRTFQIGFYFPAPNNTNQNTLQGLASTFGLTWHIEQ